MSLADALSPEGVVLAFRQDGPTVEPVDGEQTGIPAYRDHRDMISFPGSSIYCGVMGGDISVIIKTVDYIEFPGNSRSHDRQVGGTAAAEDQNIQLVLPF